MTCSPMPVPGLPRFPLRRSPGCGRFGCCQLKSHPAEGLVERVRTVVHDRGAGRWRLYLTREQMVSVAYGLWLHRLAGSAAEANRFSRDCGLHYQPPAGVALEATGL
ncbi:DUF6417 family protein [Streptomyces antibioticus]|uniref:DUF6417 family protein n=1 Tax=Streptomyces antibioticus TaxID=1890 RepID=UPI0033B58D7C